MSLHVHYWTRGQETQKLRQLFIQHWHDDTIVAREMVYRPEDLEKKLNLLQSQDDDSV
jgi:hypothetical protein